MEDREAGNTSAGPASERIAAAEMHIADAGHAGWSELHIRIGYEVEIYGFTMVFDPLNDIRRFERDLSAGGPTRMVLPGEPGATEVTAEPGPEDGYVRLRVWLIDHAGHRSLDLDAIAPVAALACSLRRNTGFLAVEYGLREARYPRDTLGGLWQALRDWLRGQRPS